MDSPVKKPFSLFAKRFEGNEENRRQHRLVSLAPSKTAITGMGPAVDRMEMETVMTKSLRRWRSDRRYKATLRALSNLTARQLSELGIRPVDIQRLAREAASA